MPHCNNLNICTVEFGQATSPLTSGLANAQVIQQKTGEYLNLSIASFSQNTPGLFLRRTKSQQNQSQWCQQLFTSPRNTRQQQPPPSHSAQEYPEPSTRGQTSPQHSTGREFSSEPLFFPSVIYYSSFYISLLGGCTSLNLLDTGI